MDDHEPTSPTPPSPAPPSPAARAPRPQGRHDARRRQLVAGGVAVLLTALTAFVAVRVNFGAASAQSPSQAGRAAPASFVTVGARSEDPPTVTDPATPPRRVDDDERDEHEDDERYESREGHDDDD